MGERGFGEERFDYPAGEKPKEYTGVEMTINQEEESALHKNLFVQVKRDEGAFDSQLKSGDVVILKAPSRKIWGRINAIKIENGVTTYSFLEVGR